MVTNLIGSYQERQQITALYEASGARALVNDLKARLGDSARVHVDAVITPGLPIGSLDYKVRGVRIVPTGSTQAEVRGTLLDNDADRIEGSGDLFYGLHRVTIEPKLIN